VVGDDQVLVRVRVVSPAAAGAERAAVADVKERLV
jgi:hypothetical protein